MASNSGDDFADNCIYHCICVVVKFITIYLRKIYMQRVGESFWVSQLISCIYNIVGCSYVACNDYI